MKTATMYVLAALVLLLVAAAAGADEGQVALYTTEAVDNCNLYDTGSATHEVYVVYTGTTIILGIEFKLEQTYDAGLTYLGETIVQPRTLTAGRTDTGISLGLGECLSGSNLIVLKVWYQGLGVSAQCSQLRVKPNPDSSHINGKKIACVDCNLSIFWANPTPLIINPDENCACASPGSGGSSPVAVTTWGGIKAMYTD